MVDVCSRSIRVITVMCVGATECDDVVVVDDTVIDVD